MNAGTTEVPVSAAGEGPYRAALTLARELWVLRDRQRVLEAVLARRGLLDADEIARYAPSADEQAALERECREFVAALFTELSGGPA